MSSEKSYRQFRNSFKTSSNKVGGYTSGTIDLKNKSKAQDDSALLRREIQLEIKNKVKDLKTVEFIKQELGNQEKYNQYEQYFDTWIQDAILNSDTKIKTALGRGITYDKSKEEILEKIEQVDSQVYNIYKVTIIERLDDEINRRELKKKKQEEENKKKVEEEER